MEVLCATALQDFIFEEEEPASDSEESSSDSQCSDDTTASWDFMCAAEECVNEADQYFRKIPDKLRLKLWPSGYAEEYAGLCRSCAVPCCVNDGCSNPIKAGVRARHVGTMAALPKGVKVTNSLDWRGEPGQLCWQCALPRTVKGNQERSEARSEALCSSLACKFKPTRYIPNLRSLYPSRFALLLSPAFCARKQDLYNNGKAVSKELRAGLVACDMAPLEVEEDETFCKACVKIASAHNAKARKAAAAEVTAAADDDADAGDA